MPQATMGTNLFQTFQIFTNFGVHSVGENLRVLPIDDVFLPVQEPCWDFELCRVLYDSDNALKLVGIEFSSAFVKIYISLFAYQIGISATDTLDLRQGIHNFALAINIGVEET